MQTLDNDLLLHHLQRLDSRLDAMERKLDYVVERQRFVEDAIDELIPVGREALGTMTGWFAQLEARGYVSTAKEMMGLMDRVVTTYGPDEVARLSENIVLLLDTVRNVSQPDVLQVANEAVDVVHHADSVKPVGLFGVARASGDADVQRGMAMALEILRHLGRAQGGSGTVVRGGGTTPPRPPRPGAQPSPAAAPSKVGAAPLPAAKAMHPPDEVVEWAGHRFNKEGFLLDPQDWDEELARAMAEQLGVTLDDTAWTVIRFAREEYLATGASPNVRRVATGSGVGTQAVYTVFPRSPGKTTAMLAGIPKPVGCV